MKRTLKKVVSSLLLLLGAIVLCISGINLANRLNTKSAGAEDRPTTVTITSDKDTVKPGEVITITGRVSTTLPGVWSAVAFNIAPLSESGERLTGDAAISQYFEFCKTEFDSPDYEFGAGFSDDTVYTPIVKDDFLNSAGAAYIGFGPAMDAVYIPTSTDFTFSLKIKYKSDAPATIGNIKFGIAPIAANNIVVNNNNTLTKHQADQKTRINNKLQSGASPCMTINLASIYVGEISANATLASLSVGHGSASNSVTIPTTPATSIEMTYNDTQTGNDNRTNFKFKPTVSDSKSTIKYCVGSSGTPTSSVNSNTEVTIPTLDSSGETIVKFLVTAESGATQNYTLKIVSGYARLSALSANISSPNTSSKIGMQGTFNKDTYNYTVNVPNDYTSVSITPRILSDYGISSSVTLSGNGCTVASSVTSGDPVSVTGISNNATLELTATAKDGTTTQKYTVTFKVLNADATIKSLTMTESTTNATVNSDSSKESASIQYYFLLSEASGFQGTFNLDLNASSTSTATVDGVAFSSTTVRSAKTYSFVVTAEAGNTKTYSVVVAKDLQAGTIKNFQYAFKTTSNYQDVSSITNFQYGAASNTYTYTLKYDPATYGTTGNTFYLRGTASEGATVTTSGGLSNISGGWSKSISVGKNEFSLTAATTGVGSTVYKFEVYLAEEKNTITNVTISNGTENVSGINFNSAGPFVYNITVPYAGYDNVTFTATTDGQYSSVIREPSTTFAHSAGTTTHTLTNVALAAGQTTTVAIHAQADGTVGDVGATYTFNITRDVANSDATLSSLTVTVDGALATFKDSTYTTDTAFASGQLNYFIALEKPDSANTAALVFTATATKSSSTLTFGSTNAAMPGGVTNQTFTFTSGTENTTQYIIKVTAEDKSSNIYTVTVKHVIPEPEFTDLQISYVNESGYSSVLGSPDFDSTSFTYTVSQNITDVPVNSRVYIKGAVSKEASVQKGSNLGGTSTTTGPWTGNLAFGKNEYQLTVKAGSNTKVYKIIINVIEDKRSILDVELTLNGTKVPNHFVFNTADNSPYNLTVPYQGYGTLLMTVTTDGTYTVVFDSSSTSKTRLTHTAGSGYTHTLSLNLDAGKTKSVIIHSVADNDNYTVDDPSKIGPTYTFNIAREAADDNNKLSALDVTIDGMPITFDETLDLANTFTYNHTINNTGNATASIVISATTSSEKAKVKVASAAETVHEATSTETFTFGTSAKTETYTITVTSEAGVTQTYKILIKRVLAKGDFDEVRTSLDNSSFASVMSEFTASGTNSKLYSVTYNVQDVAVGSKYYIEVTSNADSNAVPGTGLTLNNNDGKVSVYECTLLKFGDNNFKVTARTTTGSTEYNFTVKLIEDIDDISDISISDGTAELDRADFDFDAFTQTYEINVPNAISSLTFSITPEGKYNYVYRDGTRLTTKKGDAYELRVTLKGGETTEVVIYGVANEGKGRIDGTARGKEYTFKITRAEADPTTTLKELAVTIGGKSMPINFDPQENNYVIEIEKPENEASTIVQMKATPTAATSTINGQSGTVTITETFTFLSNQEHETSYTITVKAESGETGSYTVKVKRVIVPGDFETLEFAESENNYEDVRSSITKYDPDLMVYTVDLDLAKVSAGTTVRIRAIPTSGAVVTATGNIKESASANIYLATLATGRNEFKLKAKTATGEKEYTFVVNLFEGKNTVENIVLSADGKNISQDVFKFTEGQNNYDITVPFTVKSIKMVVTTDGTYTTIIDDADNVFAKSSGGNGRNHERTFELQAGQVTTIMFFAKSDKGDEGDWYEFRIMRESANSDVALKSFVVMIGNKVVAFNEGEFDPERLDYTILVDESPSYNVEIKAEPNASTSKVSGTGKFTFNLSEDSANSMYYPVTVEAEDGSTRTYSVTISQKPVVIDSNYDITRVVINGARDYYDDVPSEYNNEPIKITVPYNQSRVKVVVTTASVKSSVVTTPALSGSGYLDLPEDSTVTLTIYAVAEDGSNSTGADFFIFEITREKQGEVSGPDVVISISNKYDTDKYFDIDIDSEEALVYVFDTYNYKIDSVDMNVDLTYGGNYEILRIGSDQEATSVAKGKSGATSKVKLDYGTNVFNIMMYSSDGYTKKAVIFVFERERAALLGLSSSAIASLRDDFKPSKDDYSYNVSSNVDYLGLSVDIDNDLYSYEFRGTEQLDYGYNQIIIEIYENDSSAMGRSVKNIVRTITINVYRESNNTVWIAMTAILSVLSIALLVIIIVVKSKNNRNDNDDDEPIVITQATGGSNGMNY